MKTTTTRAVMLALLSSSGFAAGARAAANLCFFPGGIQARDVPCDPKAEVSMCCGSVNACLSNGLCKLDDTSNNTGIAYARGTCSDPTWQSPICPQNCVLNPDTRKNSSAFDFRFNGVQVWQCDSQGFGVPGKFCCESAAEKTRCCSTPAAIFGPLIAATPGNAAAVQTLNTHAQSSPTPSGSGQSSGVTGTPSQQTPDMTAAPTMSNQVTDTSGGAGASSPTGSSDNDNSNNQDDGQKGIGNVAIVGMGVGASVGGALLVAAGVMWWLRKERQRRGPVELDGLSSNGGGDLSPSGTTRIAYGGMNINNGTATVSSMGTGTYGMVGNPVVVRRVSSDWEGSPGGIGGSYQMAEIDGKETLAMPEPQGRKKSMYELP
ncbi:uncharacterized protein ColSpa_00734 [Colletotrichum spaethianum]|uniref:Uncharacterized protein n=1 Tax=Colletotrichum spaethianum TaxID=700344 RepID=A0AA37NXY1_9PEZI|nr:uncharacterized protein ColSpa_00734 [Colletotrichum spaethianum]GKT40553.1 hypothetical protein ColSpa_00734 [Colletotrichum spaethianum]